MVRMPSGVPTSLCTPATRPLAPAPIDLTAASSASRPRAAISTSAPEPAKRVAIPKPRPLLPPVTMAERPVRLMSIEQTPVDATLVYSLLVSLGLEANNDLAADVKHRALDHRGLIEH